MSLHLGNGRSLPAGEVVAVLDYELFTTTPANRHFLSLARTDGRVTTIPSTGRTRTVIIADARVVLSGLSPKTLAGRAASRPLGGAPRAARRSRRRRAARRVARRRLPGRKRKPS